MSDSIKKLSVEDLKVGLFIEDWHQLEDIYGVYIYLNGYKFGGLKGEILHFCEKPDDIAAEIEDKYGGLCVFYQDPRELEEFYL